MTCFQFLPSRSRLRHCNAVPSLGCCSGNLNASLGVVKSSMANTLFHKTSVSATLRVWSWCSLHLPDSFGEVLCSMLLSRVLATSVAFVVICFLSLGYGDWLWAKESWKFWLPTRGRFWNKKWSFHHRTQVVSELHSSPVGIAIWFRTKWPANAADADGLEARQFCMLRWKVRIKILHVVILLNERFS